MLSPTPTNTYDTGLALISVSVDSITQIRVSDTSEWPAHGHHGLLTDHLDTGALRSTVAPNKGQLV